MVGNGIRRGSGEEADSRSSPSTNDGRRIVVAGLQNTGNTIIWQGTRGSREEYIHRMGQM